MVNKDIIAKSVSTVYQEVILIKPTIKIFIFLSIFN
ncbi:MAG: hypothetical protein ACI8WA_001078 [Polaribacter sp.]|jgi:hypothetical protein